MAMRIMRVGSSRCWSGWRRFWRRFSFFECL